MNEGIEGRKGKGDREAPLCVCVVCLVKESCYPYQEAPNHLSHKSIVLYVKRKKKSVPTGDKKCKGLFVREIVYLCGQKERPGGYWLALQKKWCQRRARRDG